MIYTFKCKKCETIKNVKLKMGEELPSPVCPECYKKMKKVLHVPKVIFKGEGWTR